jgi:DNA invertase Pin-like site-specific DNA recombinase
MKTNVVIYTRVSTDKQEYERQIKDLNNYISKQGYNLLNTFSEKVSGAKKNIERPELMNMINYCLSNNVDKVIISELSRLGRNTIEVLKTVELLTENKISLYILNLGIETLVETTKEISISSKLMITMLAEFASMERTQIAQRMQSGYKNYVSNGGKVGRTKGDTKDREQLKEDHADIIRLLNKNLSIRNIAKITGKSTTTIQKVKNEFVK